jgi:exopolysaccharide production protein ExoQ
MSPALASLLCWSLIVILIIRDVRKANLSHAVWVPVLWIAICCSRPLSLWLYGGGWDISSSGIEAGSPLDRNVNSLLMFVALCTLINRRERVVEISRKNRWLVCYFLFCLVAVLWSDFPIVAFKRWVRTVGDFMMLLVVMTERDPSTALSSVLKRSAFLLLPTSILLIKYYPHLGRNFSDFTGEGQQTGVTINKNTLGAVCMVMGLFFFYHLLKVWRLDKNKERRRELALTIFILWMVGWLMWQAHSATSLAALMLGVSIIVVLGSPVVSKKYLGAYVLTGIVTFSIAATLFDADSTLIGALGRDSTLTGRTELWGEVLEMGTNPMLGAGFESFWLGERLEKLWALHWWKPTQAHNGYLEMYINLGICGLFMLGGLIFTIYRKGRQDLFNDSQRGRMRLGLLAAVIVYNWTEAAFRFSHPVFLAFNMIAIDPPQELATRPADQKDTVDVPHHLARGGLRRFRKPLDRVSRQVAHRSPASAWTKPTVNRRRRSS